MSGETAQPTAAEVQAIENERSNLEQEVQTLRAVIEHYKKNVETRNVTRNVNVTENSDSLTVGTPGSGQLKVYGDFSKPDDFKARLENAVEMLQHAKALTAKKPGE